MTTGGGTGSAVVPAHTPEWAALVRAIRKAKAWAGDDRVDPYHLMVPLFGPLMAYSRTMARGSRGQDQATVDSQLGDTAWRILEHVDLTQDVMVIMGYITTRLRGGLRDAVRTQARQATGMGRNVAAHRRQFVAWLERVEATQGTQTELQKDEIVCSVFEDAHRQQFVTRLEQAKTQDGVTLTARQKDQIIASVFEALEGRSAERRSAKRRALAQREGAAAADRAMAVRKKDAIIASVFEDPDEFPELVSIVGKIIRWAFEAPGLMATIDAVRYGAAPETVMPERYGLGNGITPGLDNEEGDNPELANALHMSLLDTSRLPTHFCALRSIMNGEQVRNSEVVGQGVRMLVGQLHNLFPDVDIAGLPFRASEETAEPA